MIVWLLMLFLVVVLQGVACSARHILRQVVVELRCDAHLCIRGEELDAAAIFTDFGRSHIVHDGRFRRKQVFLRVLLSTVAHCHLPKLASLHASCLIEILLLLK